MLDAVVEPDLEIRLAYKVSGRVAGGFARDFRNVRPPVPQEESDAMRKTPKGPHPAEIIRRHPNLYRLVTQLLGSPEADEEFAKLEEKEAQEETHRT